MNVFESQLGQQPVAKITLDPEPCMTMLLEKLQRSNRSLGRLLIDERQFGYNAQKNSKVTSLQVNCKKYKKITGN